MDTSFKDQIDTPYAHYAPSTSEDILRHDSHENKTRGKKKRKTQHCIYCQNHKKNIAKRSHVCPYRDCDCLLCNLLRQAQVTMRHQQRLWRYQKIRLQQQHHEKIQHFSSVQGQLCDMCRNHNEVALKKNHECPYIKCNCEFCKLTCKRRELMKCLQRVRRSKITTNLSEDEEETLEEDSEDQNLSTEYDTQDSAAGNPFLIKGEASCAVPDALRDPTSSFDLLNRRGLINPSSSINRSTSPPPLIPIEDCQHLIDSYEQENFQEYSSESPYCNSLDSPPSLCPLTDESEPSLEASNCSSNYKPTHYSQIHQRPLCTPLPTMHVPRAGYNPKEPVRYKCPLKDTEMRNYNSTNFRDNLSHKALISTSFEAHPKELRQQEYEQRSHHYNSQSIFVTGNSTLYSQYNQKGKS